MAVIYVNLIEAGLWTLDRVPTYWKAQVEALLAEKETPQTEQ